MSFCTCNRVLWSLVSENTFNSKVEIPNNGNKGGLQAAMEERETLIALLQVQCRSTATPTTLTASETRICSPELLISSTSLAVSWDTEVGTEATGDTRAPTLHLCFLPHPPAPRPQTQSCISHVSHGVCFRQKLKWHSAFCSIWDIASRQWPPILDPTKLNTRPDGSFYLEIQTM